jgi:hypothetical protein
VTCHDAHAREAAASVAAHDAASEESRRLRGQDRDSEASLPSQRTQTMGSRQPLALRSALGDCGHSKKVPTDGPLQHSAKPLGATGSGSVCDLEELRDGTHVWLWRGCTSAAGYGHLVSADRSQCFTRQATVFQTTGMNVSHDRQQWFIFRAEEDTRGCNEVTQWGLVNASIPRASSTGHK